LTGFPSLHTLSNGRLSNRPSTVTRAYVGTDPKRPRSGRTINLVDECFGLLAELRSRLYALRFVLSHPWRKKKAPKDGDRAALLPDHKSPGCYWMQTGHRNISKPPVSDGGETNGPVAVWRTRSFQHERARSGQSSRRCWWISAVQHSKTSPSHCRRQPLPPGRRCRGHSAGSG
jgi:hypothetical protein